MVIGINPLMGATARPPVMEARRWLDTASPAPGYDLLDLSQAAPVAPPPKSLRTAIAEFAVNDQRAHVYGPVLGDDELRGEIASRWSQAYAGAIEDSQVAVTSGCNQAFVAAMSVLAGAGDSVIITTPWYFNHKMWLDMMGIEARVPPVTPDLVPDPDAIASLVSGTTRAIVLISPNNPTGTEYPARIMRAVLELARRHRLALIVDETYRDFDSRAGPVHDLFSDPEWPDTLIHLYSFSKAFRLTGHRVGAVIAARGILVEIEKFLDTVAICPGRIGQHAALYGLRNLGDWLAGERREILRRRQFIEQGFSRLDGWRLPGCGAYFAYAEYPFALPSSQFVLKLLEDRAILTLPGSMFGREDHGQAPCRQIRIACANVDAAGIADLFARLEDYCPAGG